MVVVFWVLVIAASSILRLFPRSFTTRVLFSRQGPEPRCGEQKHRAKGERYNAVSPPLTTR